MQFKRQGHLYIPDYRRQRVIPPRPGTDRFRHYREHRRRERQPKLAWAYVDSGTVSSVLGTGNISGTYSSAVSAGSLLVAFFADNNAGAVLTGVSDTVNGGSWTQFPAGSPAARTGQRLYGYYFPNTAAGTPTVTATFDVATGARHIALLEYTGILAVAPLDVSSGRAQVNPGTATDALTTLATATTAGANELAVSGVFLNENVTPTAGTNYTLRRNGVGAAGNKYLATEDRNIATASTVVGTWTVSNSSVDGCVMVAVFKESTGGGGRPDHYYRMMRSR